MIKFSGAPIPRGFGKIDGADVKLHVHITGTWAEDTTATVQICKPHSETTGEGENAVTRKWIETDGNLATYRLANGLTDAQILAEVAVKLGQEFPGVAFEVE